MSRATRSRSDSAGRSDSAPKTSGVQAESGLAEKTGRSTEIEKSLLDIDFASLRQRAFTPSPAAWEDQVLYFLLVDRFSDGNERGGYRDNDGNSVPSGTTPLYMENNTNQVDYDSWLKAGGTWQGGTLK